MTVAPAAPRRRLRFGLRTLLAAVTLVAVAAWTYSVGWPWWVAYYEQVRFERIAANLKAGVTTGEIWTRVGTNYQVSTTYTATASFKQVGMMRFQLQNAVYFVCLEYPKDYAGTMLSAPSTRVEVYRLPPLPRDDRSRRNQHTNSTTGAPALDVYTEDFHAFYLGDRQDSGGLHIEQIHPDPPANDKN
jgi:hypothetical protein